MRKILFSLTTLLGLILLSANVSKATVAPKTTEDTLLLRLRDARTPLDSIKVLYDLFDASGRAKQGHYGHMLLHTAGRAHDYATQNDMLRQLSVIYASDDSVMALIKKHVANMPNSIDQHITDIFVNHQILATKAQNMSPKERNRRIVELITENKRTPSEKTYARINQLYSICVLLGYNSKGMLYLEMLDRLGKLIEKLPPEAYPLYNQYYTALANIYTNSDRYASAVEADRKLLKVISDLEKKYTAQGRRYRSYDSSRYLCYRRMLSNYRALSKEEIVEIYNNIQHLAARDSDVAVNERDNPRALAYYLMGTGQYAEAMPVLHSLLKYPRLQPTQRRQALKEMSIAAEATGDKETLLHSLKEYTAMVEQFDSARMAESIDEIDIRYQFNLLQRENVRLQAEALQDQKNFDNRMRVYLFVAIAALIVAVIASVIAFRRRSPAGEKCVSEARTRQDGRP